MSGQTNLQGNVRSRRGSKHDKTGCLTCRYRHKKCVENTLPICGAYTRLNLVCIREPARRIGPSSRNSRVRGRSNVSENTALENIPRSMAPAVPTGKTDSQRRCHAMSYYIKVLAELLTVSRENNSFTSDFIPLAMESPALYEALLAYASGHLSSLDSSYSVLALKARSESLNHLSKALNTSSWDKLHPESTVAASLILLTSEVCLGSHKGWYSHLIGAKHLILSTQSTPQLNNESSGGLGAFTSFKSTPGGRWILRNFAYHDVISSVTLGRGPLLSGRYLEGITDVVDTYLGVASGILAIISDISSLDIYPKREDDVVGFQYRYLEIEESLQSWRYSIANSEILSAIAGAYQASALLYLYRQKRQFAENIRGYFGLFSGSAFSMHDLDSKIDLAVQNILDQISKVPVDDVSESCLLFPLFLAGGDASSVSQTEIVRKRLQSMLEKHQFRNIHRALEILETLWMMKSDDTKQQGDKPLDWIILLKDQEEPLLLT